MSGDYQVPQPVFQLAPDGRPLSNAGARLGARVIDGLIQFVLLIAGGFVVGMAVKLISYLTGDQSPVLVVVAVVGITAVVVVSQYAYEVEVPLRWNGQTPGKRMLKIAIAPLEPGARLSRGQLAGRWGLVLLFNLLANCYIGLIDPLWCLWDKPYRQCLHDKPAKTVVVRLAA
ncbi:RDD family protein [Virgisporangium aurantiacum]|uniref:RDD family protein n=2 Tax=Virgisporangium aurantiacum TaxID=175570 RepID=A0A8J4E8M0_9ACTN|nr:RDD family protein [Virgisporangium aurantiacum]